MEDICFDDFFKSNCLDFKRYFHEMKNHSNAFLAHFETFQYINEDMNYSSAQSINSYFNKNWDTTDTINESAYCLKIWISSKIPYYTVKIFKYQNNVWQIESGSNLPVKILSEIDKILNPKGVFKFPEGKLLQIAQGCCTDLDGRPANHFEVFFSEID